MIKFIERYEFEFITGIFILFTIKLILFGYNLLGFYDFNDLFLK
jgi:hypothetical protein